MANPGLVILAVLALGALFVLLPVALTSFFEHRGAKGVICPETGARATVGIDAGRAARGSIFGLVWLSAESCSRWPERSGCAQGCLIPPTGESAPADEVQA